MIALIVTLLQISNQAVKKNGDYTYLIIIITFIFILIFFLKHAKAVIFRESREVVEDKQ